MPKLFYDGTHPAVPPGVIVVELTRGYIAWIDDVDAESVLRYDWHACVQKRNGTTHVYACTATAAVQEKRSVRLLRMHRHIIPDAPEVDHRTHSMLDVGVVDNRQSNLRAATRKDNARSMRKCSTTKTSKYKGVGFETFTGRWKASINTDGKSTSLGRFREERDAALAYDVEAVRRFGTFALTNFPVPGSSNWLYDEKECQDGL